MSNETNAPPVRVGFIGCGQHACQNIYPRIGPAGAELVAAADLSESRLENVRRNWHPEHLYQSGEALLEKESIDALFVVGPAVLHEKMLELAIDASIPVFVEKPPATSSIAARKLADKARTKNLLVMTGFMKRYASNYRRALEISSTPEFGGPRHLVFRYSHGLRTPLESNLPVMGIHAIDLVRTFMGDPVSVQVRRSKAGDGENLSLQMSFENNRMATVILDSTAPAVMERMELTGEGHLITIDELTDFHHFAGNGKIWNTPSSIAITPNFSLQTEETSNPVLQGYSGEVDDFIRAVSTGQAITGATLDDGAAALELCERIAQTPDGESFSQIS